MAQQSAAVQPEAQAKAPSVWLDMDQQALDDAYDQEKYAPNRAQIVERLLVHIEPDGRGLGLRFRLNGCRLLCHRVSALSISLRSNAGNIIQSGETSTFASMPDAAT